MSEKTRTSLLEILGSDKACWLDGTTCPYGSPGGKFMDRPTSFCFLGNGGCAKLNSCGSIVNLFIKPAFEEQRKRIETEVSKAFGEHVDHPGDYLISRLETGELDLDDIDERVIRITAEILQKEAPDLRILSDDYFS